MIEKDLNRFLLFWNVLFGGLLVWFVKTKLELFANLSDWVIFLLFVVGLFYLNKLAIAKNKEVLVEGKRYKVKDMEGLVEYLQKKRVKDLALVPIAVGILAGFGATWWVNRKEKEYIVKRFLE